METVIFLIIIGAILLVVDRVGDRVRPVEHSSAYRQALAGMIREPRAQRHVAVETGIMSELPAPDVATGKLAEPAAELVARPTW